jgi:ABC-2 type transport system permease protein
MAAVRWLLVKDLRILRRSPLLSGLLVIYPVLIAVLIGIALSRSPGLPRVAFLDEIPAGGSVITIGGTRIDIAHYERELFQGITPVYVHSRAQALADVRDGSTLAALIIPPDLPRRLATGDESAYVQAIYNGDAIGESLAQSALSAKLAQANTELAVQLEKVADGYIDLLLSGGRPSTCSACAARGGCSPPCSHPCRPGRRCGPSWRRWRRSRRPRSTTSARRSR